MNLKKLKNYHKQAKVVAEQSPDSQTQVGALLIHSKTGAVLGSGFNGFIRKGPDRLLPKTRPEKYQYIIHAETNLLYNCARHGISTDGCFIYCTLSPCVNCLRAIYQSGIVKVYFKEPYSDFEKNIQMKDLHILVKEIGEGEDKFYDITLKPRTL